MTSSAKTKGQTPGAVETSQGFRQLQWISPREANLGPKCNALLSTSLDQSPNY